MNMDSSCERVLKATKNCKISAGVVDVTGSEDENYVKGGILADSTGSWVSCGSRLITINCQDGSKQTGWTFGWALNDPMYKVVCVEELPIKTVECPVLIVCCEGEATGSSLCFWHSGSSRVLKAIYFNEKITSLSVVSKSNEVEENLSKLLRPWNGIVAVGTGTGKVYILDIWWKGLEKCMEDYRHKVYDEERQSKIAEVSMHDLMNHIEIKTSSVRNGSSTLALWLNEDSLQRGRGVQNILGRTPREFLSVSALKYFPQIAMLAVGYNTSCFQLWNLSTLTLQYTSALLETMLPVYTFALLEPSDDPKDVCYLWLLHHSVDEDTIPFAGMYLLSYREKHLNRYINQFFYEGLSSCHIRYRLDLGNEIENVVSGRIISCQTIHRGISKSSPLLLQSDLEGGATEDNSSSLLTIVWEVWTPNQTGVMRRLTLFDLNQWYREYMPYTSDVDYSQFMAHFCLPVGSLLAAKVLPNSVRQFVTLQPVDEHFYPSATSFECVCLEQFHVVTCSHVGLQKECLQAIQEGGPSALILPSRLYELCIQAGIKVLLAEPSSPTSCTTNEQREYVLSVALENDMTHFLCKCVRDWADGSHAVAHCTLPSLLHWAWGRVQRYKKWLDRLCVPLFDYSGTALDSNDLRIFQQLISLLHSLHNLFSLVLKKYRNCILQDSFEQQHIAIAMVTVFYDSVRWCVRNKVLPEMNVEDALVKGHIPYLTEKIVNFTITRRAELHHLAKSLKHPAPTSGLLLIDAVIAQEADSAKLTDQWEREGGGTTVGKYPPPSVQSLLRTYLVRDIPVHIKHFIVSYFLQDIVHELSSNSLNENLKQKLLQYPLDFGLTESQCKIVQAFWCLDHKNFEEGVSLLLDSCVNREDLCAYQHRTVVSLLAASGHHKLALRYLNQNRSAINDVQDIRMKMALLLVSGLIHEAFQFQRQHSQTLSAEFLQQFFEGCVEMNKLDIVFKLPLTTFEEEAFMEFLEKSTHPQADDLRVLYLLSRSRYIEAIDMNEKLRSISGTRRGTASLPLGHSPLGPHSRNLFGTRNKLTGAPTKAVLTTRDLMISSVAKSLPSVTRELADLCAKEKNFSWKQVPRPTPLSVVVHTELNNERLPFYKMTNSQFMEAAVNKTRETWAPLLTTPAALKRKMSKVEDTPFLRTPILSRLNNSSMINMSPTDTRGSLHPIQTKRAKLDLTPGKEITSDTTCDMEITCPESIALINTPLVTRSIKHRTKDVTTPHSILKGRSATNTPVRGDRSVGSPAVRQIRFSLPHDSPSSDSSLGVKEAENSDGHSPSISPRKSIHTSSVLSRKGTPVNPRLPRKPTRNMIPSLKFDDEEITSNEQIRPERSATAEALLKKISSSPTPSDDSYFIWESKRTSSSNGKNSNKYELSFKLPLGLEENMDFSTDLHQQDSSTDEQEFESESNSTIPEKNIVRPISDQAARSIEKSYKQQILKPLDEMPDLTSAKEVKIVVECSGKKVTKTQVLKDYDDLKESFEEANESLESDEEKSDSCPESNDAPSKIPIFKWTKDLSGENSETLKLQVSKQDKAGLEKCVATVTLSEEIPMFYSESIEAEVNHYQTTVGTVEKAVEETKEEEPLSEEIQTFYSESVEAEVNHYKTTVGTVEKAVEETKEGELSNDKLSLEKELVSVPESEGIVLLSQSDNAETDTTKMDLEHNSSLSDKQIPQNNVLLDKATAHDKVSIIDMPLPQVLEEILKRGRISSSPKDKPKMLLSEVINNKDDSKDVEIIIEKEISSEKPKTSDFELGENLYSDNVSLTAQKEATVIASHLQSVETDSKQMSIQECTVVPSNRATCKKTVEDVNVESISASQSITINNSNRASPQKELTFGDLPEDKQIKEITSSITSKKYSFGSTLNSELIEDSAANIELQLSEGDSIENDNKSEDVLFETEKEMGYETIEPKEFQTDVEDHYSEEYLEEDYHEGSEDEDIYGDIGDEEEPSSPIEHHKDGYLLENENYDERASEDKSIDVICLDSSSNEDTPNASSSIKRKNKFSAPPNETLDYEYDFKESDEEKEEEEESEEHEDESEEESEELEEESEKPEEESEEPEEESEEEEKEYHGRRSWKTEARITGSSESMNKSNSSSKEDNIDSPLYENIGTKDTEIINIDPKHSFQEYKNSTDQQKISESKIKQLVETGSILDLKKRRSKRYSSTSDLSFNKGTRARRRSCSFHDFASMIISETKSAKSLSTEREEEAIVQESNLDHSDANLECSQMKNRIEISNTEMASSTPIQQSHTAVVHEDINSKASSLIVEPGSVTSSQQEQGVFGLLTARVTEYQKIRGKSIVSHFTSSLQNITEEMSCSSGISGNPPDNTLRRSLSNNDLEDQNHFKGLPRRSSSVTRWSEYVKAHKSEMGSDLINEQTRFDLTDMSMDNSISAKIFKKSQRKKSCSISSLKSAVTYEGHEMQTDNGKGEDKTYDDLNKEIKSSLSKNILQEQDCVILSKTTTSQNLESSELKSEITNRMKRAYSEPPMNLLVEKPDLNTRRRSSSLLKIQNVHNKVLRHSLKGKYCKKFNYNPLEVILHSDEDSITDKNTDKNLSSEKVQSPEEVCTKKRGRPKKVKDDYISKKKKTIENANEESSHKGINKKDYESSEEYVPSVTDVNDDGHSLTPTINSQVFETSKKEHDNINLDQHSKLIDSPARRTRQRMSRISDTESVTSTKETCLTENSEFSELKPYKLKERAQSEPSVSPISEFPVTTKRRSSSLLKIQKVHEKVFRKGSLRKYSQKVSYEPLETIVQSDEESLRESNLPENRDQNLSSETVQSPGEILTKKRGRPQKIKDGDSKKKKNDDVNKESNKKDNSKKSYKSIEEDIPNVHHCNDDLHSQKSSINSQVFETPKKERKNISLEHSILIDSPARRTRRSMSRLSDTDLLMPIQGTSLSKVPSRRRTRRSGTMSDLGSPSKYSYAESEASDVSTSSKVHTPSRQSLQNQSFSGISTPGTPDFVPEEYLLQRRLTRSQYAQLQKSFECSLIETPRISRLEDVPEEESTDPEKSSADVPLSSTPLRTSARNANKATPTKPHSAKQSRRKTTKK